MVALSLGPGLEGCITVMIELPEIGHRRLAECSTSLARVRLIQRIARGGFNPSTYQGALPRVRRQPTLAHMHFSPCVLSHDEAQLSQDRKSAGGRRVALLPAKGYPHLTAELAVRTWLLVALNEANRRVQLFPQKLTQAASV
jgi:hypothetical protein